MENDKFIGQELDSLQIANYFICDADNVKNLVSTSHKTLNVISQNIRSLNCNLASFSTLLQRTEVSWDLIVLTECWLQSNKHINNLNNYHHISTTSHRTQNEGVVVFYNTHLDISHEEPTIDDANCLLVKLNHETCIISIYRPPSQTNIERFINSLDTLLASLRHYKNIILCGDINIDIVQNSPDKRSYDYLNLMASHSILPCHTVPTHGKTSLDHMMLKTKHDANCFIFESSVTDHECVAISLTLKSRLQLSTPCYNRVDYEGLDRDMEALVWHEILKCDDVNRAADLLTETLKHTINTNTKQVKTSSRKRISKPWITLQILRCMRNRDNLYKKLKKDPKNEVAKTTYKRYRNFCTSLLKKAKRNYESQELEKNKNNKKKLWETIKTISGTNKQTDHSPKLLSSHNPQVSINKVNEYFSSVGRVLAEKHCNSQLPVQTTSTNLQSTPSILNSLVLLPTTVEEVYTIILRLRNSCAVGYDQISSYTLKRYAYLLSEPIAHICNLSISTGVFPEAFKIALIKPIHKVGDRDIVGNYRPISILPSMSKVLERLINHRLVDFLEKHHLIAPSQYGFRKGKSTNDAVHELKTVIVNSLDRKQKCLSIFIDLAKAFDTVSTAHLLSKLHKLGIRGLPLRLVESYLSNRKQKVKILDRVSDECKIDYGVPQGSILGPTLFLVYIDELCRLELAGGKIFAYADDTALCFAGDSWNEVFMLAQSGFQTIVGWLQRNVLTLNVLKTKFMTFALRATHIPPPSCVIKAHSKDCSDTVDCNCEEVTPTENIKYLGVTIDRTLSFRPHIQNLVSRLRKLIYVFKNLRHVADHNTIKMVFFALGQSITEYCILSWGGAAKTLLLEAERAHRAILKVSAGLPYRFPTDKVYKHWDLLSVRKLFVMHTILKQHTSNCFNPDTAQTKRRKDKVCRTMALSTALSHRSHIFLGPYIYNKLNKTLNLHPLTTFQCKKKTISYLKTLNYQDTENLLTVQT